MSTSDDIGNVEGENLSIDQIEARAQDQLKSELSELFQRIVDEGPKEEFNRQIFAAIKRADTTMFNARDKMLLKGEAVPGDMEFEAEGEQPRRVTTAATPSSPPPGNGRWIPGADDDGECDLHAEEIDGFLIEHLRKGRFTAEEICDTVLDYFGPHKCCPCDRDKYDIKYRHRVRACLERGVKQGKYKYVGADRRKLYYI
jgi:hypothetical protein